MRWVIPILVFMFPLTTIAQDQQQWDKVVGLYAKGKVYSGIKTCSKMLSGKTPEKEFLVLRAEGQNKIGENDKAMRDAREAYALLRGDLKRGAALQTGVAMAALGAPDSARTWLERSLGSADDSEAWYRLGLMDLARNDRKGARTYFDKVLEKRPDHVLALSERGGCYAVEGDSVNAKNDLDRALELEPRNAVLWNSRGYYLYAMNDKYIQALSDYDRAIKLDPNYSFAFNNRGWAYYKLGERSKALKNIKVAAKKRKTNPFVYRNLGVIALESGDTLRACGHFRTALSLQFTEFHGDEVLKLVEGNCGAKAPVVPIPPAPTNAPLTPEVIKPTAPVRSNAP